MFRRAVRAQARWCSAAAAGLAVDRSPATGVLTITLDRPKQRNALSLAVLRAMEQELWALAGDDGQTYRAVVIQGNGPAFCSGHDLKEMASLAKSEQGEVFDLCSRVMQLIETVPQVVVTAVHGVATAAGCQMVAASDLTVATHDARFCTPGVNIGLFCSTPAVPLVRCIGRKPAMDMLATGRLVSVEEAQRWGLVNQIVTSADDADAADADAVAARVRASANALATGIAAKSGAALAIGKRTLHRQLQAYDLGTAYRVASQAMHDNMQTKDAQEGIGAFLGRRTPTWTHS